VFIELLKNNITLTIGQVTGEYFECKFDDYIKFMEKIKLPMFPTNVTIHPVV